MAMETPQEKSAGAGQELVYFVDLQEQRTTKQELTVQRILEKAGQNVLKAEECLLYEFTANNETKEHTDPNERIRIVANTKFFTSKEKIPRKGEGETVANEPEASTARAAVPPSPRDSARPRPTSPIGGGGNPPGGGTPGFPGRAGGNPSGTPNQSPRGGANPARPDGEQGHKDYQGQRGQSSSNPIKDEKKVSPTSDVEESKA